MHKVQKLVIAAFVALAGVGGIAAHFIHKHQQQERNMTGKETRKILNCLGKAAAINVQTARAKHDFRLMVDPKSVDAWGFILSLSDAKTAELGCSRLPGRDNCAINQAWYGYDTMTRKLSEGGHDIEDGISRNLLKKKLDRQIGYCATGYMLPLNPR